MKILTWNLFHGRSQPPAGIALCGRFAELIAGWEWDVALLQEVPPWWPPLLAGATGAEQRTALTSRNAALPLRRVLAERLPDLLKSNGGGSNAVLARRAIAEHRAVRLRLWPERRVAQLVRLGDGACLVNFHASTHARLAAAELKRLWALALSWSGSAPLILGGDLNLRRPAATAGAGAGAGILHLAAHDVDHLFGRDLGPADEVRLPTRRARLDGATVELSDHQPLLVTLGHGRQDGRRTPIR